MRGTQENTLVSRHDILKLAAKKAVTKFEGKNRCWRCSDQKFGIANM